VQVTRDAFREALARLVLDVPLSIRPSAPTAHVMPASGGDGARVDSVMQQALRLDYGRWCQRHEVPGDCLSLLQDGLRLDARDRLTLAVGFSLDTVWDGVTTAVREQLSSTALKALVAGFVTSYVLMLAAPEPVITKAVAVVLTGYLIAYLGLGPFWSLVQASRELKAATEKATTFSEVEEAGHHFGRVLGENGARILILAVTASLGGRAGMLAKGPLLPGFASATLQAETQLGLELAALSEARSITLTSTGGIVVRLASGAAASTTLGVSDLPDTTMRVERTQPSGPPDANARPGGRSTQVPHNADVETRRSLLRENESAERLAQAGYKVEQNPKLPGERKPDYLIEGRTFDNYAPKTNKPRNIWSEIDEHKVNPRPGQERQAERIIINLTDSAVDLAALKQQFQNWPMRNLKEVLVITREGLVIPFWP
jgi:hypothetical protein